MRLDPLCGRTQDRADAIAGTETRSYVLTGIGQAQARAGQHDLAAEAFAAARLLLTESTEPRVILTRFETVAVAEQIAGMEGAAQVWADGLELAMTITDDGYRISALARFAESLARAETMRAEVLAETP